MGRKMRTVLEYRSYALPVSFPLMILTGDRWYISDIPSKRLHFHNCLELGYCHEGSGTMLFYEEPCNFHAGDVTCVARNVPHTTYSDSGTASLWSYIYVDPLNLLGPQMLAGLQDAFSVRTMLCSCHLMIPHETMPQLAWLFQEILSEMQEKSNGYEFHVRGLCLSLMTLLCRLWRENPGEGAAAGDLHVLQPAINYIHDHYNEQFEVKTLADLCFLSSTHFRRLFTTQVGTNPLNYVHQTRILESCNLLRSSEMSIAEISRTVGYATISNYNRHFLSLMGCTPSAWRKISDEEARPTILTYSGWLEAEKTPSEMEDEEP